MHQVRLLLLSFFVCLNAIAQENISQNSFKIDSGYFTSFDKTKIYYEVSGEGDPVLLVHGFVVNSSSWKQTALYTDLLNAHYKVITLDLRGNGKSDHPQISSAYANDAEAKDIMALLKSLKITQYKAVGYSRGSIIVARLLALDKNIQSAVLGGMGTGFTDPNWDRPKQIYEALSGNYVEEFEPLKKNIRKWGMDSTALALMQKNQPFTLPATLSKIRQPVLLINGDQDDQAGANALSKMIPNSSLVSVPGGHNDASRSKEFSQGIIQFLKTKP